MRGGKGGKLTTKSSAPAAAAPAAPAKIAASVSGGEKLRPRFCSEEYEVRPKGLDATELNAFIPTTLPPRSRQTEEGLSGRRRKGLFLAKCGAADI